MRDRPVPGVVRVSSDRITGRTATLAPSRRLPPRAAAAEESDMSEPMDPHDAARGVPAPLIPVLALIAGALLQRILALPAWSSAWRWPIGAALLLAGMVFGAGALRLMRRERVSVNPYRPTAALLVDGPFRLSRNPMYVSLVLYLVAFSLWLRLPWSLALTPVAVAILHFGSIVPEERHLARRFGDDYRRYRARVRAWI